MVGLGFLPGGAQSQANAVSADGSTIVGQGDTQAFRWTSSSGMVALGLLAGDTTSDALAASSDGSTIVGWSKNTTTTRASIWDSKNGMRSLQQVLTGLGLDLSGWTLEEATGVSADGETIVGFGLDPQGATEAWVAVIPEPGTGLLVMIGVLGLAVRHRHARGASLG